MDGDNTYTECISSTTNTESNQHRTVEVDRSDKRYNQATISFPVGVYIDKISTSDNSPLLVEPENQLKNHHVRIGEKVYGDKQFLPKGDNIVIKYRDSTPDAQSHLANVDISSIEAVSKLSETDAYKEAQRYLQSKNTKPFQPSPNSVIYLVYVNQFRGETRRGVQQDSQGNNVISRENLEYAMDDDTFMKGAQHLLDKRMDNGSLGKIEISFIVLEPTQCPSMQCEYESVDDVDLNPTDDEDMGDDDSQDGE